MDKIVLDYDYFINNCTINCMGLVVCVTLLIQVCLYIHVNYLEK